MQSAALLPPQPTTVMLSPSASGWAGDEIHQELLANTDMVGREHSATGVFPHPFFTPMSLQQMWVAISSLASTSTKHCNSVTKGLSRLGWAGAEIHQVLLANTVMFCRQHSATGVLPHLLHTPMSLQQLWVAISSLASTSTNRTVMLSP